MNTKRNNLLLKIIKNYEIKKEAQENIVNSDIDQNTADKMAEEIFDTIFDEEIEKLIGQ